MDFTKLGSGLLIPQPKDPPPPTQAELREQYSAIHQVCPECAGDEMESTCIGGLILDLNTFRDTNTVWCSCGWTGITHDLVPRPKEGSDS